LRGRLRGWRKGHGDALRPRGTRDSGTQNR
jgi:hypothetical protein